MYSTTEHQGSQSRSTLVLRVACHTHRLLSFANLSS